MHQDLDVREAARPWTLGHGPVDGCAETSVIKLTERVDSSGDSGFRIAPVLRKGQREAAARASAAAVVAGRTVRTGVGENRTPCPLLRSEIRQCPLSGTRRHCR